jgi:hypothetical protein
LFSFHAIQFSLPNQSFTVQQIMVNFDFQDVTSEQYDNVWKDLRASGNAYPKGLLSHVAAAKPNGGWKVVDVWESAERFQAFGDTLMPLLEKNNIPQIQPEILPVHWIYEPQMQTA